MSGVRYVVGVQIPPVIIKRGALGTIRIGSSDIEIPSEDVTVSSSEIAIDLTDVVHSAMAATMSQLKAEIEAKEKLVAVAPTEILKWREVKSVHASEEKRSS